MEQIIIPCFNLQNSRSYPIIYSFVRWYNNNNSNTNNGTNNSNNSNKNNNNNTNMIPSYSLQLLAEAIFTTLKLETRMSKKFIMNPNCMPPKGCGGEPVLILFLAQKQLDIQS